MGYPTVTSAFRELLSRIELSVTQASLASQRYNAVKKSVESKLPGKEVRQIGSFQRKTKIRPINEGDPLDIDLVVCFGNADHFDPPPLGLTPARALEIVRGALVSDGTYRLMNPKPDSPTVVLEYSDGGKVELTPCYRDMTGLHSRQVGPACYIVGSPGDTWVPADYDYDAAFISGTNRQPAVAQTLVPSIKIIKQFLRGKGIELKSFHVEVICALTVPQAVAHRNLSSVDWGYHRVLADFLSRAANHLTGAVKIPGSYSPAVDSGLSFNRLQEIVQYLGECGKVAGLICELGDEEEAVEVWREFYGDPFPA